MRQITRIFIIFLLTSCADNSKNTIDSRPIDSAKERIEVLEKEIIKKSEFHDAEFLLFNVNGFSKSRNAIPGASSWDYQFVVKVEPTMVTNWTIGFQKSDNKEYETGWTDDLVAHRDNNWERKSTPQLYNRVDDNTIVIVYQKEGIVFKRVIAN
ncbi:hypothetical protein [Aquimarina sediminis]|uniref:hypothetical protein n=1 Tax=Aquimarina sediminis TaxID=2070536 RepID=UPI000CA0326E|nr:hypothetical protein [Aquimarina sediminis]